VSPSIEILSFPIHFLQKRNFSLISERKGSSVIISSKGGIGKDSGLQGAGAGLCFLQAREEIDIGLLGKYLKTSLHYYASC
jgi:hypothetical protein